MIILASILFENSFFVYTTCAVGAYIAFELLRTATDPKKKNGLH